MVDAGAAHMGHVHCVLPFCIVPVAAVYVMDDDGFVSVICALRNTVVLCILTFFVVGSVVDDKGSVWLICSLLNGFVKVRVAV